MKERVKMEFNNINKSVMPFEDRFVFKMNNPFDIEAFYVDNSTEKIENLDDLFRLRNKLVDDFLSTSTYDMRRRSKRGYKVYDKVSML